MSENESRELKKQNKFKDFILGMLAILVPDAIFICGILGIFGFKIDSLIYSWVILPISMLMGTIMCIVLRKQNSTLASGMLFGGFFPFIFLVLVFLKQALSI